MSSIILYNSDKGRTIEVKAKSIITVSLKENPTTGYQWKVETTGGLEIIGDTFKKGDDTIGSSGVRNFQFLALEAGAHKISIKNWREWEGESSIVDRFYAIIIVVN